MYRKIPESQLTFEEFKFPYGKLDKTNVWVQLEKMIPWDLVEAIYRKSLAQSGKGAPALTSRIAFGSLIIQARKNLTDRQVVEEIRENLYLQYFLGYNDYRYTPPFDASMLVHFRKRFDEASINKINEYIVLSGSRSKMSKKKVSVNLLRNHGKLLLDATVAPSDITYPTDVELLNKSREVTEKIIDTLHEDQIGKTKKPRTYRKIARRLYLYFIKKRKKTKKLIRKAVRQQLGFIRRNLGHIDRMLKEFGGKKLSYKLLKSLQVVREIFRQQTLMYERKIHSIPGRIVSLSQPHVRPIVRGKSGSPVEFGLKFSMSVVNGYSFIDRMSWEPYNESEDLQKQVEKYKKLHGFYPKSVHADKIYMTRANYQYCKSRNIRLSGIRLGRFKKIADKLEKQQIRQDAKDRIAIEGKFGQGKRRFGLDEIKTKLSNTSQTSVSMIILAMNLEKKLIDFFVFMFFWAKKQIHLVFLRYRPKIFGVKFGHSMVK